MNAEQNPEEYAQNQRIRVFARCRPRSEQEVRKNYFSCVEIIEDCGQNRDAVKIRDEKTNKTFYFDKAFGPSVDQIDVYRAIVSPLMQEVLMGYNCTVFACGQTGSGKTYTMEGERSTVACSWEEDPGAGIIPRAVHQLFEELAVAENIEYSVHVSFLEIYNEKLIDLLSAHETKLKLFEDSSKKSLYIQGLQEIRVNTKEEVYSILERGTAKRQMARTELNDSSSRSHTIFSVTVNIQVIEGEELPRTGKINLVDLAGSEDIEKSGAVQKTAQEAGNINQSLLTLGKVISEIVSKQSHISYNSKLTRLLKDSLSGCSKTSIIATVSPADYNICETYRTLDYAQRAMGITIKPEINQRKSYRALIKQQMVEIERLRSELSAARNGNGYYVDHNQYMLMQQDLLAKDVMISQQSERIEELSAENEELRKQVDQPGCDAPSLCDKMEQTIDLKDSDISIPLCDLFTFQRKLNEFHDGVTGSGHKNTLAMLNSLRSFLCDLDSTWKSVKHGSDQFSDKLMSIFSQKFKELMSSVVSESKALVQTCRDEVKLALEHKAKQTTLKEKFQNTLDDWSRGFFSGGVVQCKPWAKVHKEMVLRIEKMIMTVKYWSLEGARRQSDMVKLFSKGVDFFIGDVTSCDQEMHKAILLLLTSVQNSLLQEQKEMEEFLSGVKVYDLEKFDEDFRAKLKDMKNQEDDSLTCSLNEISDAFLQEVYDDVLASSQHVLKVREVCINFSEERASIDKEYLGSVGLQWGELRDKIHDSFEKYSKYIDDWKTTHEAIVNDHASVVEEQNKLFQTQLEDAMMKVSMCEEELKSQSETVKSNLATLNLDMENFLVNDSKENVPPGEASIKGTYQDTVSLAHVLPHVRTPQGLFPVDALDCTFDSSFEEISFIEVETEHEPSSSGSKLCNRRSSRKMESLQSPIPFKQLQFST